MNQYVTGAVIKELREKNRMTQLQLTTRLKKDGFEVVSGPRTTGDNYYESCIVVIEGNQIEIPE